MTAIENAASEGWDLTPLVASLVQLEPGDSRRLFHGRGGCYPGLESLTLDYFDRLLVATLFRPVAGAALDARVNSLAQSAPAWVEGVCIQHRYDDGAPVQWLRGERGDYRAVRGPLSFDLLPGNAQNLGFFLDMEPGRQWLAEQAAGKRVLNLFAYTCAFSVVAIDAGASAVVNVDMSSAALSRGRENHRRNQQPLERVKFLAENILKSWGRIRRAGPYDIVIIDPPSFQRGSFVATNDYAKVLRRLPELLPAGGDVLACLNAPELDSGFLLSRFEEHCPAAEWLGRLTPSADFPDADVERALKLHRFRLPASPAN